MVRKNICLALIAATLLCLSALPAYSASEATVEINQSDTRFADGIIKVSGTVSAGSGHRVTMLVVKPGYDWESVDETSIKDAVVGVKQMKSGDGGEYQFTFEMKDSYPSGYYTAVVGGTNVLSPETYEFYFVDSQGRQEALDAINQAHGAEDILDNVLFDAQYKLAFELMGFKYTDLALINDLEFVALQLYEGRPYSGSAGEVMAGDCFNKGILVARINETPDEQKSDMLLENADILGIDISNGSLYAYVKLTGEEAAVLDELKNTEFDGLGDLQAKFNDIMMMKLFKKGTYGIIAEILPMVYDQIGISLTGDYAALSEEKKTEVHKALVNKESILDIQNAFTAAVAKAARPDPTPTPPGKGTGAGGGAPGGTVMLSKGETEQYRPESEPAPQDSQTKLEFSDVDADYWGKQSIDYLADINVISGFEDGTFRPEDPVTREQFVVIIAKAFKLAESKAGSEFTDVDASEWYAPYVAAAYSAGVVQGTGESVFGVGDRITREDMLVIMLRTCEKASIQLSENVQEIEFDDAADISEYAMESVRIMQRAGIISGREDNMFAPKGITTRAEAAKVVYALLQAGGLTNGGESI